MEYEIQIPDEIGEYSIIKLTLQPLVENALYHGIKNKRGLGKISVTGEIQGSTVFLYVEDNGIGILPDKLKELNSLLGGTSSKEIKSDKELGFGIVNVSERIKLNYGKEYGIYYESEYGMGTKVTVKIPVIQHNFVNEEVPQQLHQA